MPVPNNRTGSSGQGRAGDGYRQENRRSREPEPTVTVDVSAIVFGPAINPKLYSDVAESVARAVAPQRDSRGRMPDLNKATQLRRFYDELVMLQTKVGSSEERFRAQEPFVQMLKAKVAYALGRKKVDGNFDQMMRRVVDQIKDPATFGQAKLFMEAFMAFYKVYRPED